MGEELSQNVESATGMQMVTVVNINSFHLLTIRLLILLHEKFLQFDWLRAVVFQPNLKYLHVKITKLLRVVV